jgi:pyruvate carboxylase subunit B
MLPICHDLDALGFWSIEAWGGATFDACVRYLREDPWERLRKLRKALPNSRIQMLLRGQNLLGYRHYSDDVVDLFVKKSADNGVDVFRIFDAMNDLRNIQTSLDSVKKYKKHAGVAISYTTSPVHDVEYFTQLAKEIENNGADSLAIKDMAGLLTPKTTKELVSNLAKNISLPIHIHSHATSGLATANLLTAVENGATMIDTCNSSFSEGASHPTTESVIAGLHEMGYETGVQLEKIENITGYLKNVRKKYWQFESEFTGLDPRVLINQVPGGMISNLSSQLKDQGALDKMDLVLEEIPRVREDLGFPPLVTPTSQIVGTQAALNIITGERYKSITNEVKNYFLGEYGKALGNMNEEVMKKAIGDETPLTCRPADMIKPEINNLKVKCEDVARSEEDLLTYAMFPDLANTFLKERNAGTLEPEELLDKEEFSSNTNRYAPSEFNVTLHGETYHIKLTGSGNSAQHERPFHVVVDGISEEVLVETLDLIQVNNGDSQPSVSKDQNNNPKGKLRPTHDGCVTTAMPGTVIDVKVNVGDQVSAGDALIIIEAMKMENEIQAPKSGTVVGVHVSKGDSISPDTTLIEIQA